jgi:membrane protease YdiL (CAAX protease family)
MTNKKTELKRLLIFLFFAFAISWIPVIIFNKTLGYNDGFETNKYPVLFWIGGFAPALANVLTRAITKEGWHDSMLHLNLKGNIKYYVAAFLIVVVLGIAEGITTTIIYGNRDFSDMGAGLNGMQIAGTILTVLVTVPLLAFNTFGEEFGWRGYMNQKMEPLLGTTGTVIVGGIIWGLWHAVLTVEGHNFGKDYDGYPWLGILLMCIFCTYMGIVLMWLTKKTGSIYPAAIMHAANNNGGGIVGQLFISGVPEDFSPDIANRVIVSIPSMLICCVFLVLMIIDKKRKAKAN